jgi:hypothetical protein
MAGKPELTNDPVDRWIDDRQGARAIAYDEVAVALIDADIVGIVSELEAGDLLPIAPAIEAD